MNKKDFNELVEKRISLIRSTLASKGGEYTSEGDVLESFKTIAHGLSLHDDSTKVLWELLTKHLYSVKRLVDRKSTRLTPVTRSSRMPSSA